MNKNFDAKRADIKDIRPVVLKKLEEKYGIPFECIENSSKEDLERYPLKTVYVGEYAPKKNEKNKTVVWISNMDEMKDDYSQYFVMKEATSNIQSLLSGVSHVNHLVVIFNSISTSEEIASDISLEDYLETTGATYDIELTIEPDISEDVQASTIQEILNRLYDKFSVFNLSIKNSDEKSYLYSTYYDSERSSNKPTHSEILKEIEEQKEMNKDLQ